MSNPKAIFNKVTAVIIFIAVTSFTLHQFALLINDVLKINYTWYFELAMVVGMLLFQLLFLYKRSREEIANYFIEVLKVSFFGSIALFPLLIVNHFYKLSTTISLIYFFIVVLAMFFLHKYKVHQLNLPIILCYTWVLYRLIILIFIV